MVAAAVVFAGEAEARSIDGLDDSKNLSPEAREQVYAALTGSGASIAVAYVDSETIDRINILQAALEAMARALNRLNPPPDAALVDGNQSPAERIGRAALRVQTVVKGDAKSLSIAAASIAAKVERDRWMTRCDRQFPQYGFARHKGYPTQEHRDAIARSGPSPIHRRAFRGVREHLSNGGAIQ